MTSSRTFLVGGVLFWGWQTGHWGVAVAATLLLCGSLVFSTRWDFSTANLRRVADFSSVLIALLGIYWLFTIGSARGTAQLFLWLPVCLLPMALAHFYGTTDKLDASVLFWSLRRDPPRRPMVFDPSFPYMAIWILGASAANSRGESFFAGLVLLTAISLVRRRPLSYPVGTWAAVFCCAASLGYAGQYGLHEAQLWLEDAIPDWIAGTGNRTNPYRSNTDLGHIGELKSSSRIVLRVDPGGKLEAPLLLHRASYNQYSDTTRIWIAGNASFRSIPSSPDGTTWSLTDVRAIRRHTIHDYSGDAHPVLSLPGGTASVENLVARGMRVNPMGAVQLDVQPGHFSYVTVSTPGQVSADPPTPADTRMGRQESKLFSGIADQLALRGQPPEEIERRIRSHFHDNFQYATYRGTPLQSDSVMRDFMERTRAGHCEYFATATVMLFRAAGIPARYATGFSVQEYSETQGLYLARELHAHAWVHAWLDGAWRVVDTTPPDWFAIETPHSSLWSTLSDLWSWLRFRFSRIDIDRPEYQVMFALLVLLPASLWLGVRLYRSRRIVRSNAGTGARVDRVRHEPGYDSEFYAVERHLAAQRGMDVPRPRRPTHGCGGSGRTDARQRTPSPASYVCITATDSIPKASRSPSARVCDAM